MTDFVTADLHFSHTNIIKFCPVTRYGMKDADHMNSILVAEWNRDVQPEDTVYILGDVAFGRVERATAILQGLNGRKILIAGNHDHKNLRDPAFRACFDEVHPYYEMTYNGTFVVMFHYPIHEWNQMHRGAVHLHGHVHGGKTGMEQYRIRDVAFDATGKVVSRLEDVINDALKGEIRGHHHKE
jgi:calcineurin-like phosphoesterase family protein